MKHDVKSTKVQPAGFKRDFSGIADIETESSQLSGNWLDEGQ